jgi:hypothetical protein
MYSQVLTAHDGNYNFDPSKPSGAGNNRNNQTKMGQAAREERKRRKRQMSLATAYNNLMYSCAAILTCGCLYGALASE